MRRNHSKISMTKVFGNLCMCIMVIFLLFYDRVSNKLYTSIGNIFVNLGNIAKSNISLNRYFVVYGHVYIPIMYSVIITQ